MKKRIIALFALLVFLFLPACGGRKKPAGTDISAAGTSVTAVTSDTGEPTDMAETSAQTPATTAHTEATTAEYKYFNGLRVIDFTYKNPVGEIAYRTKSISDMIGANPWKSTWTFEKLPVYVNKYPMGYSGALYPVTADTLAMVKNDASAMIRSLGLTVSSENTYGEDTALYTEKCGNIEVNSGPAYLTVSLRPGQSLITVPQSYAIGENSVKKDLENIIMDRWGQLSAKLSSVKPVGNPVADVRFDYNFAGDIILESGIIFDMSENKLTAILNYNFDYTDFYLSPSDTSLNTIAFSKYDLSEKFGDYPVISPDAAKAKLLSGDYIPTTMESFLKNGKISTDDIAWCELLYLKTLTAQRYFIPAYRFFVALDPDNKMVSEPGYVTYGEFWVPAVESGYINVIKP